jgi:hypothetical protein
MALAKTVNLITGFQAVDAYHRVEGLTLAAKDKINFRLRVYKDGTGTYPAFDERGFDCAYDLAGANPLAQAYAHLKTLPEYADAQDC